MLFYRVLYHCVYTCVYGIIIESLIIVLVLLVNPFRSVQSLQLATRWDHYGILWKNRRVFSDKETTQACGNIFHANGIADEKKVPVFLSIAGGNIYTLYFEVCCHQLSPGKDFCRIEGRIDETFSAKEGPALSPSGLIFTGEIRRQTRVSPSM